MLKLCNILIWEDTMNYKNAICFIILSLIFGISVQAYTTPEELTSPESLINYNYSAVSADHVQLIKAQNANRPYKSPRTTNKKWWRKVWEYIDFGTDDGYLLQHDIGPGYTWKDL